MPKREYVIRFAAEVEPGSEPDPKGMQGKLRAFITFKRGLLGRGTSIDVGSIVVEENTEGSTG